MDKTIREVAEMLGVSKQAIQYHVKTLPTNCYQVITKGKQKQIMIKPSGLQALMEKVTNKETDKKSDKRQTKTDKEKEGNKEESINNLNIELQTKVTIQEKEIELLREMIQSLEKDKEQLNKDKDNLQINLNIAQQMQVVAENRIKLLESKQNEQSIINPTELKKSWFQRLFKK